MHKEWADSITKDQHPFIPAFLINNFRDASPFVHQILATFNAFTIPRSDIYLLEGITCILPAIIREKKNSKIIILNCDNFFEDVFPKSKGIKRKLYEWYIKHIDGVISNSEYVKDISEKYIDVPNFVVNPGINKKFFKVNANYNSGNIAHGLSAIRKQKGSDLVIEAFEKIKKSNKLYLIGPKKDVIIPDDSKIILTGWTDHPEEYLKKCSIFVNPARTEPFGMNIIEAMAAGFAPIISKNCGAKEAVEKLDKKLIIKPTVSEIIKAINWLNESNRKEVLGKKAKIIAKKYMKEESIKRFRKTFFELVKEIKK